MIKCPYCEREGAEYSLDYHLIHEHGVMFEHRSYGCAWCGCPLKRGATYLDDNNTWREHLNHCTAFQAWLLSGVLTGKPVF